MTATIGLVLDCTDPTELAHFWSRALGYTTLGGAGNYVMLVDADGVKPNETHDVDGEAARLESIGARRLEAGTRSEHGSNWVILADLEGNEFCVCDGRAG